MSKPIISDEATRRKVRRWLRRQERISMRIANVAKYPDVRTHNRGGEAAYRHAYEFLCGPAPRRAKKGRKK